MPSKPNFKSNINNHTRTHTFNHFLSSFNIMITDYTTLNIFLNTLILWFIPYTPHRICRSWLSKYKLRCRRMKAKRVEWTRASILDLPSVGWPQPGSQTSAGLSVPPQTASYLCTDHWSQPHFCTRNNKKYKLCFNGDQTTAPRSWVWALYRRSHRVVLGLLGGHVSIILAQANLTL